MDLLRVEAAMLRTLLPDLVLREGMRVVASVAERAGQRGIIVLAGTPLAAQLPDGLQARITVAEREEGRSGGGGDASHDVRLTYTSARLGAIDLHLALAGEEALRVNVRARTGAPSQLAERHAAELEQAVAAATGKAVQVLVSPRHDPFDAYA